jgi:hypothetical protein
MRPVEPMNGGLDEMKIDKLEDGAECAPAE